MFTCYVYGIFPLLSKIDITYVHTLRVSRGFKLATDPRIS